MIARLGLLIARIFRATTPDPFVLVVLLTLVAAALALVLGSFPGLDRSAGWAERASFTLDQWRGDGGLWRFLAFSMQMCLVLLTGHALASAPLVRRAVDALAGKPRTTAQAAVLVAFTASATALVNWGLGLIVGALLARDVGRSMSRRGLPCHYPLVAAAGYMGLMIWHGGLSGSAPLSMTTLAQARRVLPAALVDAKGAAILVSLDRTLLSPLNIAVTLGLLAIIPLAFALLSPRRAEDMTPFERCSCLPVEPGREPAGEAEAPTIPDRLDSSPLLAWTVGLPLLIGLARSFSQLGWQNVGLSEVIALMLALGLVLHGSLKRYAAAVEAGAGDCAGIVIQFPFYGGILALMASSGLAADLSAFAVRQSTPGTLPLVFFLAASILNMFITSGGGLWGVMGPVALDAGAAAGVDPARMVMSVAYGDQITNMLQPFWALPLLAITGVKARDIVGYTALVMVAGFAWIVLCLLVF
jgi:short-chain fatty acids transporter